MIGQPLESCTDSYTSDCVFRWNAVFSNFSRSWGLGLLVVTNKASTVSADSGFIAWFLILIAIVKLTQNYKLKKAKNVSSE